MLYFSSLDNLHTHLHTLQNLLKSDDIFVVWWSIRDLLLWITQDPKDIDITLAWDPDTIRESMHFDTDNRSRFRTEKFWTMTFLPKQQCEEKEEDENQKTDFLSQIDTWWDEQRLTYELTPFRTEWSYSDNRHPDEIAWSPRLIEDANRRDFTINAMYRYGTSISQAILTQIWKKQKQLTWANKLLAVLEKQQTILLYTTEELHETKNSPLSPTLIIQDVATIDQLFLDGRLQKDYLSTLLENTPQFTYTHNQEHNISSHNTSEKDTISSSPSHTNTWASWELFLSILIDPHHGVQHCISRTITTVWSPDERFQEDALRIIRGVRFVNTLNQKIPDVHLENNGYDIDKPTRKGMQTHASLVQHLAGERLHAEITKVFSLHNPFWYTALIHELWLLHVLFPAVADTIGNIQPIKYHPFDTYNHTILTLHALQTYLLNSLQLPHRIDLMHMAMLYHDVWKPAQYEAFEQELAKNPDNPDRSSFVHHTESWVDLATKDLKKLCFPKKDIEEICRYIRRHHRPWEILQSSKKKQLTKIRQLLSTGGKERCLNLISIAIADRLGQYNPLQSPAIEELELMKNTIIQLDKDEWRFLPKDLVVNGHDIIKEHNITPWPLLWEIIQKTFTRVLTDLPTRNTPEQIHQYIRQIHPQSEK